jgi:cytochrome c oxidase assembly protein subunit 15
MRYRRLALIATVLALTVVVLGAYVRLSDAGLGCPDWPGCYGQVMVPDAVTAGNEDFDWRPLDRGKAWKEMLHRYVAGGLGLLIVALAIVAYRDSRATKGLAAALVGLVIFQAVLGMWTVTLLLKPLIVVLHLLGGMSILALLWWVALRENAPLANARDLGGLRRWLLLALAVVCAQIFLGGWTSANYAALVCTDFPTCQGRWWPASDYRAGFTLWRGLGTNYEFGVLDTPARTAIHWAHRCGALVAFSVVSLVAYKSFAVKEPRLSRVAMAMLVLLVVQVSLGIGNVMFGLPLAVATAHNGVAAALLLSLASALHLTKPLAEP